MARSRGGDPHVGVEDLTPERGMGHGDGSRGRLLVRVSNSGRQRRASHTSHVRPAGTGIYGDGFARKDDILFDVYNRDSYVPVLLLYSSGSVGMPWTTSSRIIFCVNLVSSHCTSRFPFNEVFLCTYLV